MTSCRDTDGRAHLKPERKRLQVIMDASPLSRSPPHPSPNSIVALNTRRIGEKILTTKTVLTARRRELEAVEGARGGEETGAGVGWRGGGRVVRIRKDFLHFPYPEIFRPTANLASIAGRQTKSGEKPSPPSSRENSRGVRAVWAENVST